LRGFSLTKQEREKGEKKGLRREILKISSVCQRKKGEDQRGNEVGECAERNIGAGRERQGGFAQKWAREEKKRTVPRTPAAHCAKDERRFAPKRKH